MKCIFERGLKGVLYLCAGKAEMVNDTFGIRY